MNDFFASLPTPGLVATSIGRFFSIWFQDGDQTVPGTTDLVLTMGVIIVSIIILPIIANRRRWMR